MLGWEESLRQQVACRNDKESVPFRGLVQEHGDLQVECRELRVLVEKLKRENEKYGKENELLLHDTQAGKGGKYVHASAPRVKSLEAEVALLRTDADDFRRSQQRVITRYDDDLTQTKQLLEKSEAKCKNLEEDKSELLKLLNAANANLSETQATLQQSNTDLETAAREKDEMQEAIRKQLLEVSGRKLRGVVKAIEDLREEFQVGSPSGSGSSSNGLSEQQTHHKSGYDFARMEDVFTRLHDLVEDSYQTGDELTRDTIRSRMSDAGAACKEPLNAWLTSTEQDLLAHVRCLNFEGKEGRLEDLGLKGTLEGVSNNACFLYSTYVPCDDLWGAYVAVAIDVYMQLGALLAGPRGGKGFAWKNEIFRVMGITAVIASCTAFFARFEEELGRRSEVIHDPQDGHSFAAQSEPCLAYLNDVANKLSLRAANAAMLSIQQHLQTLYTIDMANYKKYKHKDAYLKENRHLKQATETTMQTLLDALSKSLEPPSACSAPLKEYRAVYNGHILKLLTEALSDVLLQGGANRWYYTEQSVALSADMTSVSKLFVRVGVPFATVSKVLARLSSVVSGIMSQPTEELIGGGSVCVPFTELPEQSSSGIWCKATVRQVLASRKDKKAKQFSASKLGKVPKS